MNSTQTLEARIQRLEDIEAIKSLTATYAFYVDKGLNGKSVQFDKLPSVFCEDARWKCAAMKVDSVGINNIVDMLKERTASGTFSMHSFTNPIIEIDGDSATATWLLWVGVVGGAGANEVFQREDLKYKRTSDGWKILSIDLHFGAMLK